MTSRPQHRPYNRRVETPMPAADAVALMDEAIAPRPEMRDDPRPDMREESSRDRAERRAREIFEHLPDENEASDSYDVTHLEPDGFVYQWKMRSVTGMQYPQQQIGLAKTGWETVPAKRHPELMPHGWTGADIERDGLVLMERPARVQKEMVRREREAAKAPIRSMREKLSGVQPGQFARVDSEGRPNVKLVKAYSPTDIRNDDDEDDPG